MSRKPGEGYTVRPAEPVDQIAGMSDHLCELARIGFFTIESGTFSSTWSREVFRHFGFEPDAPPAGVDAFTERYHPEDRNHVVASIFKAFETGEGFDSQYRVIWPNGEVRHLWSKATCEVSPDGAKHLRGITQDLTELRASEAARLRDLGAYRFLADNMRDLITRTSLDGRLIYASPSCKTVTGHTAEELVGRRALEDNVHPDDRDHVLRCMRLLFDERQTRDTVRIEYRFRHKDGRWIWLEASPRLAMDAAGRVLECVDVARDITQRKLDEEALAAARVQAYAAAAAKSEFLANMSHELRTPLTSILGYAHLIGSEGELSARDSAHLARVQDAGRMLLEVVNDILDFSRLETGAVSLRPEPLDLGDLVRDAAEMIRPLAEQKALALEVSAEDARLVGDPARLRQVLLNLLGNAVKFTDAGAVALTATVRWRGELARVRLAVRDTGIGVPAEQLPGLFDRFSQVDGSTSRRFGGAGLGLAITKRLCELMGAEVGVFSDPGVGSTFWVEVDLPRAAEGEKAEAPDEAEITFERVPRVLIAEDHKVNQALARALLESMGCEVEVASDGAEAVAAVQGGGFDLVLMDMQMPVMDGPRAARAIRALGPGFADLPIVAMTANVLPEHVALCREAGMADHVAKPIDVRALARVLARLLTPTEAARRAA